MESRKLTAEETKERNIELYGSKIKSLRAKAGFTVEDLASRLHVTSGSIRNWECGLARPDLELLTRMFSVLNVSPNEFFGIRGVGSSLTVDEQSLIDSYRLLDDLHKEDVQAFVDALISKAHIRLLRTRYDLMNSVVDHERTAAAGSGTDWPDHPDSTETVLFDSYAVSHADEIITVVGDSMEPQYSDGDKVLVQYCEEIRIGDIGIFYAPGYGGLIKQRAYDRLHSLNPDFDDIFPYEDGARTIGKVLGKITPDMIPDQEDVELYHEAEEIFEK